jgi:hypothetical protein
MSNLSSLRKALDEIQHQLDHRPHIVYGRGFDDDNLLYRRQRATFEQLQAQLSIAILEYRVKGGGKGLEAQDTLLLARRLRKELMDIAAENDSERQAALVDESQPKLHAYHGGMRGRMRTSEYFYTLDGKVPIQTTLEEEANLLFSVLGAFVAQGRSK